MKVNKNDIELTQKFEFIYLILLFIIFFEN